MHGKDNLEYMVPSVSVVHVLCPRSLLNKLLRKATQILIIWYSRNDIRMC